jgi:hypothetical protein
MKTLLHWCLIGASACACACTTVAPYQRGYLARDDMALEGNPGFSKAIEKTFAAKEAASGGASVGGGGCGCN